MNSDLEIKNLLLKIYEGQVRIEKRLGRVEEKVEGLEEKVEGLEEKVEGLEEKMDNMQKEIIDIKERLGRLENIVTVMQQEHGDKLDALFDAFKMQNEKLFLFEERLEKDERKIERNENQIYNLSLEIKSS